MKILCWLGVHVWKPIEKKYASDSMVFGSVGRIEELIREIEDLRQHGIYVTCPKCGKSGRMK